MPFLSHFLIPCSHRTAKLNGQVAIWGAGISTFENQKEKVGVEWYFLCTSKTFYFVLLKFFFCRANPLPCFGMRGEDYLGGGGSRACVIAHTGTAGAGSQSRKKFISSFFHITWDIKILIIFFVSPKLHVNYYCNCICFMTRGGIYSEI